MKNTFRIAFLAIALWSHIAWAVPPTDPEGRIMRAALAMRGLLSTPANPPSGYMKIYPKTDGKLYTLDAAGVEKAVGTGSGGTPNYIINPSADSNATDGVTCSNATLTRDSDANKSVDGIASYQFQASALNGYCQFATSTIPLGEQSGTCGFSASYMGDAANIHRLQLFDGSGKLVESVPLPASRTGFYQHTEEVTYPCGAVRSVRLTQTEAGTGQVLNVGRVTYSRAVGIGTAATSRWLGSATTPTTLNCGWTRTGVGSDTMASFAADADCPTATVAGEASAPATKIPAITFTNVPAGRLICRATGGFGRSSATVTAAFFQFFDGTNGSLEQTVYHGDATTNTAPLIEGELSYSTPQSNLTVQIRGRVDSTAATAFVSSNLMISCTHYPSASETTVRTPANAWYVDAMITGGNPSLGTANVTAYTEMTDSSLVLTPAAGSAPVGAVCSSTNAASAPVSHPSTSTCSAGSEGIGFTTYLQKAGVHEVCASYGWEASVGPSTGAIIGTQLVETASNSQTILQEGGTRLPARVGAGSGTTSIGIVPHTNCSLFNFSSAGQKTIRLMYEQGVSGSIASSLIVADASSSFGQRNVRFTMRPYLQSSPAQQFVGSVTSRSAGALRFETANFTCSSSSGVNSASTPGWVSVSNISSGQCTLTFNPAFSATPWCWVNPGGTAVTAIAIGKIESETTTSATLSAPQVSHGSSTISGASIFSGKLACVGF